MAAVPLNAVPPYGRITASERWRDSPLVHSLKGGGVCVLFEDLGVVDFVLPSSSFVLFLSESDATTGNYRRRAARFRQRGGALPVVLVDLGGSAAPPPGLQSFVVLVLGLTVLPVAGVTEASQLLCHSVHGGGGGANPFLRRPSRGPVGRAVLSVVQQVPGVGRVKALALLQRFPSILQLSSAAPPQLEAIVGPAAAHSIHRFFHTPLNSEP